MTKKNLYQKLILYGVFILFLSLPYQNYSQTVIRQCISSYGYASSTTNVGIYQTAGQCFSTVSSTENNSKVLQGFQQPVSYSIEDKDNLLIDQLNVLVYPNPATHNVNIMSQEKIGEIYIQVTDMMGKTILLENISDFNFYSIGCESWSNGIYFISMRDSNQKSKTVKLVISK